MNRYQRIVHNQADFRDRNERSARGGVITPEFNAELTYVCECSDPECTERVDISDGEYERVRTDPNHFVLRSSDHIAEEVEKVVEEHENYVIAEKVKAREISERRDPRNLVKTCRIVVVDDVVEVRILLKILVQMEPECTIVAEAGTGREAVEACKQAQPGVVVLDLEMPDGNGYEVLPQIVDAVPGVRVIIFSGSDNVDYRDLAEKGAFEVVPKGGDTSVIMSAIRNAAQAL